MLAVKLIVDQGIEVTALHIETGFGSSRDIRLELGRRAEMAGADFRSVDVRDEYIKEILFDPVYGYGKNFNPCIDCHGYMFKIARAMLPEMGASFLITGEVVGQRPMSQRSQALEQVGKLAGEGEERIILRPLCAKLLKPTLPEEEGWVDREKLLDISGRSRDRQLAMAKEYGWKDYESPGGGCLLTEPAFSRKLQDFIAHEEFGVEDIDLLKFGRHFRLPDGAKLVVGRDKEDNEMLSGISNQDYIPVKLPIAGPFSLLHKDASPSDRKLAAQIAVTYGRSQKGEEYEVKVDDETIVVSPLSSRSEAHRYFVLS